MVVAMIFMGMMEMAVDQIVDVIAMRHSLVAAAGSVNVVRRVSSAAMVRRATIGIDR